MLHTIRTLSVIVLLPILLFFVLASCGGGSGTGNSGDTPPPDTGTILFEEDFEDTGFASRGWYDNPNLQLSTTEYVSGSTGSAEFRFLQSATTPTSGGAIRMKFTDSDEVYVSYYVKYSANWEGSNRPYHPHEFLILTSEDSDWSGPSVTYLTAYIEQNEGAPMLALQDSKNIDTSNIGIDLTDATETRATSGCNGAPSSEGYTLLDCYNAGEWRNAKEWRTPSVYFQDTPGQYYKNDWHHVEAYFKLNSILAGTGLSDGVVQYWYDGALVIDHSNVVLRTGQHPNMQFNQFLIAPYIGDGSPVDQTMWVDNLVVATSRIIAELDTPQSMVLANLTATAVSDSQIDFSKENGVGDK